MIAEQRPTGAPDGDNARRRDRADPRLRLLGPLAALAAALAGCGDSPAAPATGALATAPVVVASTPPPLIPVHGCRLPLSARTAGGGNSAGFLKISTSTAAADPSGTLLPGTGGDPRMRTAAEPVLRGAAGATPGYDRAAGRWVPAPPQAISPDGSGYAYGAADGVHLVDVRSAADRLLHPGGGLDVLAWEPEGIYAVHRQRAGGPSDGLWLLDPASAEPRRLRVSEPGVAWTAAGGGAAWASAVLPGDAEEVWRLDPATGTVASWLHRQGAGLLLVGVDAGGHPLVQVAAPQASSLWLITAPGQARQVSENLPGGDDTPGYPAAVTDPGGPGSPTRAGPSTASARRPGSTGSRRRRSSPVSGWRAAAPEPGSRPRRGRGLR